MTDQEHAGSWTAKALGVISFIIGLTAMVGRMGYLISCVDLGSDLGMDKPWLRAVLHLGSLCLAMGGILSALASFLAGPSWRLRIGAPLPGLMVSVMAYVMWRLGI